MKKLILLIALVASPAFAQEEEQEIQIEMFDFNQHIPSLDKNSQQVKDIERFQWFTQDYLGYDQESGLIIDIRYSVIPNEITPMWGLSIEQNRDLNKHPSWWASRSLDQGQLKTFKSMLTGEV